MSNEDIDLQDEHVALVGALRAIYQATLPAGTVRASDIARICERWDVSYALEEPAAAVERHGTPTEDR